MVTGQRHTLLVTKGAPEEILAVSTWQEIGESRCELGEHERDECAAIFRTLSGRGLRVLAVAYREVEGDEPLKPEAERDLIFGGFLTFVDPPLEGVSETIAALRRDGVRIMILTGDNDWLRGTSASRWNRLRADRAAR